MSSCWCIASQDYPRIPEGVKGCTFRRVSDDSNDEVLLFDCRHTDAQKVEYHNVEWYGKLELSNNIKTCPLGFSVEAGG